MTASERLRELGERQREYGWPGPPVRELFGALSLIADVVEAAERMPELRYSNQQPSLSVSWSAKDLRAALTALREALEADWPGYEC